MIENFKDKLAKRKIRINRGYITLSILCLSFLIVIIIISTTQHSRKIYIEREFYFNSGNWDGEAKGEKISLYNNWSFKYTMWHWEMGEISFYGKWDLKGDTLLLNADRKHLRDIRDTKDHRKYFFENAEYKIFNDSLVNVGGNSDASRIYYNYDSFWINVVRLRKETEKYVKK